MGNEIAHTLTTSCNQGYYAMFIDMNPDSKITELARCITTRQDSGISKHKGEHSGVMLITEPIAVLTPEKTNVRQQGRRFKQPNEPMFTITVTDRHGVVYYGYIRLPDFHINGSISFHCSSVKSVSYAFLLFSIIILSFYHIFSLIASYWYGFLKRFLKAVDY